MGIDPNPNPNLDEPAVVEGHLALGEAYRVLVGGGLVRVRVRVGVRVRVRVRGQGEGEG